MRFSGRTAAFLPILAAILFGPLLAWRRRGPLYFWWGMSLSVAVLVTLGCLADRSQRLSLLQDWRAGLAKKIGLAVLSSLVLFGLFWTGDVLSRAALPSAGREIEAVYSFKQDASVVPIVLLLVLVIGPGGEAFWAGFWQGR